MKKTYKRFEQLGLQELYDLLALRTEVFVVEQNCPYQDLDGYDEQAIHVMFYEKDLLIGYCRVFGPHIKYETSSIGRVIVKSTHRKQAIGHELIQYALEVIENEFHTSTVTISAQEHLQSFYMQHGFEKNSDTYLEDSIPHIQMIRK